MVRGRDVSFTATWLGRAGLLPFIALAAALVVDVHHAAFWQRALGLYALGILCFLLGSWWGMALIKRYPSALLLSNGLFLVAFFSYLALSPATLFFVYAAMFVVIVLVERRHPLFAPQPSYYARLRAQLSAVAAIALCTAALAG